MKVLIFVGAMPLWAQNTFWIIVGIVIVILAFIFCYKAAGIEVNKEQEDTTSSEDDL